MKLIPVRCCCQPQKLLGWLPAPDAAAAGDRWQFVAPATSRTIALKLELLDDYRLVSLPIAWFVDYWRGEAELAYKSEETPIDVLRRIRAFVEAPLRVGRELPYEFAAGGFRFPQLRDQDVEELPLGEPDDVRRRQL